MNRRALLEWVSRGLGALVAAVIGLPGVQYVRGTLQQAHEPSATFRRVARLRDLPQGRPLQVPILGELRDAWTVELNQVVGRVWLVRNAAESAAGSDAAPASVSAFTTICPHMGCQVQLHGDGASFLCPCHRAAFGLDGARVEDSASGERNHAPRGLDSLECRVVQDAGSGESWVEVLYQRFEAGLAQKVPT